MTKEERKKIYAALAAPFPESCIQRTNGRTTGRGYDTTGIGYQFVVNRLNEVLGAGGFWVADRTMTIKETATSKGRPAFEAICELRLQLGEWSGEGFVAFAESVGDGGHTSTSEADAKKGAYTNGFKKAAAFLGVGREAYEGSLDDDNVPGADVNSSGQSTRTGPSNENSGGRSESNTSAKGRITVGQLDKLGELVTELQAGDWQAFRAWVRKERGINVEYADKETASDLISDLIGRIRRKRLNGKGGGPHDAIGGQS